jgi:hypothetical protein
MQFPNVHTGRSPGVGIPRINWKSSLSSGLVAAYYPAAYSPLYIQNSANPGAGDLNIVGGVPVISPTQEGPGLDVTATGAFLAGLASPQMQPNGRFSAFFRAKYLGNAGTNVVTNIFGMTFNTSLSTNGRYVFGIFPVSATAANQFGIGYGNSSSTFLNTSAASGTTLPANRMASGGIVALGSRSTNVDQQVFQNGVLRPNNNTGNIGFYGATPWIVIGEATGGGNTPAAIVTTAYYWNVVKSQDEMQFLDENPYALWLWPSDFVMSTLVGKAAVTPTSAPQNPFLSPLTVGLGGAAAVSRIIRRNPLVTRRRLLRPWE